MQTKIIRYVAINDRGYRIGESHQKAKLSDATVDRIRELHEDEGVGYRRIAKALGLSTSTVRMICCYLRRAQTYEKWKKIEVLVDGAPIGEPILED